MVRSTQSQPTGKRAPRKKTGCLACRARHTKCDEKLPRCSACMRKSLRCERPGQIIFEPHAGDAARHMPLRTSRVEDSRLDMRKDSPSVSHYLLRRFQDGIATWIDLFDHQQRYQRLLMRRVPRSELLQQAICALSARQLALQQNSMDWDTAASEHYSIALRMQSKAMEASSVSELLLPATLLLASYELMLLPGHDYSQHLLGAKAILEAQFYSLRKNALWLAAYWHFFRHDVSVSLSQDRPLLLKERFWLQQDAGSDVEEDGLGNASLLLIAKALRLVHGLKASDQAPARLELQEDLRQWNTASHASFCIAQLSDRRPGWYTIPAAPPAKQQALVAELLLRRSSCRQYSAHESSPSDQDIGEDIVSISSGEVSDAAQVQAVHYLCYVTRTIQALPSKQHAIDIMRQVESRTGFHTASRISAIEP